MKTCSLFMAAALAAAPVAAPVAASAQFGHLGGGIPGLSHPQPTAAVDPDSFLADTFETTKFMMTAAAILADAAGVAKERGDLQLQLKSIQDTKTVSELGALKASFQSNVSALSENKDAADNIKAKLAQSSPAQRKLIAAAAFNFALGSYRNVRLSQEVQPLMANIVTNPALLTRAGELKTAAGLVAMEAKSTVAMAGSMKTIMTAANVDVPKDASTTKPMSVQLS